MRNGELEKYYRMYRIQSSMLFMKENLEKMN